jgi:lactate dehydrogenase-like 2-hydroxyacid dehydrogenase
VAQSVENIQMKQIVVYRQISAALLARLQDRFEVTYFEAINADNYPAFAAAIRDAHGMLGAGVTVGHALLKSAQAMEAIATISAGYDNFDLEYLSERGIVPSNTPDVLSEAAADAIFALLLATARRIVELRTGRIHAAGLDVFEQEPLPMDSPLLEMGNVVAVAHIGSATHETREAMARLSVDNLIAAFEGRPQNLVSLGA